MNYTRIRRQKFAGEGGFPCAVGAGDDKTARRMGMRSFLHRVFFVSFVPLW
jgi:hypothetical protein